jgi:hypothetical protein
LVNDSDLRSERRAPPETALRLNDASRCGSGRCTPSNGESPPHAPLPASVQELVSGTAAEDEAGGVANSEFGDGSSSWGEKVLVGSGGNVNCTPCATHLFSGDEIVRASQSEKQALS